jgi:hypothetical protein
MRSSALSLRLVVVAVVAVVALSAACGGDSTGPGGANNPRTLAARFDSMYVSLNARGTQPDYFWRRASDMYFFEIPAAFGTTPVTVSVRVGGIGGVGGVIESWKGFEVQYDSVRNDGFVDSTYWVAAYKGADLNTFFIAYYEHTSGVLTAVLYGADTSETRSSSGDFFSINTGATGSCAVPREAADTLVNIVAGSLCEPAAFGTSLMVHFPPGTEGLDSTTISIQNATIPGILYTRGDTSVH